jgi:hypothetical protein
VTKFVREKSLSNQKVKINNKNKPPKQRKQINKITRNELSNWFSQYTRSIQKIPDWVDNKIYAYNNKH